MGILESGILTGYNHSLVVRTDGTLWAWGANNRGQLGLGDKADRNTPTQVGTDSDWSSVAIGAFHSVATRTDGTLWTAGYNTFGQLGLGDAADRADFIQVGSDMDWSALYPGGLHTIVKKSDDTIHAFGLNNCGQLGLGDVVNRFDPVEVGVSETWDDVAAGVFHTLGIKGDGTLWGWGDNTERQLGQGEGPAASTSRPHLSPVQIGSDHDWIVIAAGFFHSMAIRVGNTLWGWGHNGAGQIGDGESDRLTVQVPTQIGSDTNWSDVLAGLFFTIAKKSANTLWTAGDDEFSQLGQGDLSDPFSLGFAQVGSDSDWSSPTIVGRAHVVASKTSGSSWYAWGRNTEGQLGDGTGFDHNEPILISV